MEQTEAMQPSFAALFDPAIARAAAARAAQWKLPRHVCRPLDQRTGAQVSADMAAYDAAVDRSAVPLAEEKVPALRQCVRADMDSDDGEDI